MPHVSQQTYHAHHVRDLFLTGIRRKHIRVARGVTICRFVACFSQSLDLLSAVLCSSVDPEEVCSRFRSAGYLPDQTVQDSSSEDSAGNALDSFHWQSCHAHIGVYATGQQLVGLVA